MDTNTPSLPELVKRRDELGDQLNQISLQIKSICKHESVTRYETWLDNYLDVLYDYECNVCHHKWGDTSH